MKTINTFAEKKKIYRLLAIAMAEDDCVSFEEKMAIATVLMYRYLDTESRNEKSWKIHKEKGFGTFLRHVVRKKEICEKNNDDVFDRFIAVRKKISCHRVEFNREDFLIIDSFNCRYISDNIKLTDELKDDLLGSIILEQIKKDIKNELYKDCLTKDALGFYELKTKFLIMVRKDSQISEINHDSSYGEFVCKTLDDYYEKRVRPLIQNYLELCMLCLLLVEQSLAELMADVNGSVGKSVFMNVNSLTKQDKERELKEMVYVIKSDRSMMDREREAFRVVCKIFRVKGSTNLWKELSSCDSVSLLNNSVKSTRVHYKDSMMDINDFNNVQQSICSFDVKGKIINGAYHVLQRSEIRKRDEIYLSDKKWSSLAVWTFGVSALILYFFVADLVNQSSGRPFIFELDKLQIPSSSHMRWISLFLGIVLIGWFLVKNFDLKKRIVIIPAVFIVMLLFSIRYCFNVKWSDMVATFFIPLTLVAMMLSIEWLIFMRQEYSGSPHDSGEQKEAKKGNASILIVLVCAAIMIDVCLGIVELVAHSKSPIDTMDYVAKIASALILGCICFFAGKFLDMYRIQQQTDVHRMKGCIEELSKRVNDESSKLN